MIRRFLLAMLLLIMAGPVWAQVQGSKEPLRFESAEQQERFARLTSELRCLVCQNQNLADSDAPLAHDLRSEIFSMMQSGMNDDQIKQFLIDRYGDFVLYMPPFKGNTILLWLLPAALLIAGCGIVLLSVRRRKILMAAVDDSENG